MKPLSEYPVTFPYGATTPPYSRARPHKGSDIKAPKGTPVIVGDTQIGTVGETGLANGPHTHVQVWSGTVGNTVNPGPYMFKVGPVTAAATSPQWGKHVTLRVNGKNVTYAHLDSINVQVGHIIKEEPMFNMGDAVNWSNVYYGQEPPQFVKDQVGKPWKEAMYELMKEENVRKFVRLNGGDNTNVKNALGKKPDDKPNLAGLTWKQAFYDYVSKNVPSGQATPLAPGVYKVD